MVVVVVVVVQVDSQRHHQPHHRAPFAFGHGGAVRVLRCRRASLLSPSSFAFASHTRARDPPHSGVLQTPTPTARTAVAQTHLARHTGPSP